MSENFNFVIIINTPALTSFVQKLSIKKTSIITSSDGRIAIAGYFKETDITTFEYYPAKSNWQKESHFEDQPL